MALDPQTLRINSVINNQDRIPFDVIYGLIIDPTFPIAEAFRTQDNAALAGIIHNMATVKAGPLACMLVSLNDDSELILATGANKTFGILGMDLSWDYFTTPGIKDVYPSGPHGGAQGFPVHYSGGRAIVDRYMLNDEGGAPMVYAKMDWLYRSTTGMLTKDNATDPTVLGQVLHVFDDGRLDVKFML